MIQQALKCRISINPETIRARLRELAFLNSTATISFRAGPAKDGAELEWTDFHFGGGLREYVEWINSGKQAIHKAFLIAKEVYIQPTNFLSKCVNMGHDSCKWKLEVLVKLEL